MTTTKIKYTCVRDYQVKLGASIRTSKASKVWTFHHEQTLLLSESGCLPHHHHFRILHLLLFEVRSSPTPFFTYASTQMYSGHGRRRGRVFGDRPPGRLPAPR